MLWLTAPNPLSRGVKLVSVEVKGDRYKLEPYGSWDLDRIGQDFAFLYIILTATYLRDVNQSSIFFPETTFWRSTFTTASWSP